MMRGLSGLGGGHVLWLVLLAGTICVATALTAVRLFARAQASHARPQRGWVLMTGVVAGTGAWAAHFLALLGYRHPGLVITHGAAATLLSLVVATVAMTGGAAIAVLRNGRPARVCGGIAMGLGVGAIHFIGMAGFHAQARISWDPGLVATSLCLAAAFGALAFGSLSEGASRRRLWLSGAAFALAILAPHFAAMGAVTLIPDPRMPAPTKAVSDFVLAMAVAGIALLALGAGNAMRMIHAQVNDDAQERFRAYAELAADGIVIAENDRIVYANDSFCGILQCERSDVVGKQNLAQLASIPDQAIAPTAPIIAEGTLKAAQGAEIPVEIRARPVTYDGRTYHIYALRDLRETRRAQSKIRFFAEHDALTGLPNRTVFTAQLQDALKTAQDISVFFIDLDRLKDVNDIFGHAAGDAILRGVGTRLRSLIGNGALCARLSGDDFAVMQVASTAETADQLARSIITALSEPFIFGGERITLGCSIGIALGPHDGKTPSDLFARAETALRRAKSAGRGEHCFFEAELDEQIHERRALTFDLSNALAGHQFEIYYQPLSMLPSMEIMGFEALLRWHHPTRGMVPPSVFIPIAEETQLIREIGAWALRTVCEEAAGWPNPLKVSVNLSPIQLDDATLPELVQEILFTSGMTADRLELEVTETALIRNPQRSLDVLRRLKALGIRIAMDDFGTGYSSLSTLQAFPFDKIKIDKSFVERVDTHGQAASIVKAVLGLGRSLKIPVLVEGVETERQLNFLTGEGVEQIQGYLVGRPQPIARYEAILRKPERDGPEPAVPAERRASR